MAVAHDTTVKSTEQTSTTSHSLSVTVADNDDRYMVVGVIGYDDGSAKTITATYNGDAMTEIIARQNGGGSMYGYFFGLVAPDVGTANVALTISGSGLDNVQMIASVFYNVDQTTPIGTCRSATASSGNNMWIGVLGEEDGVVWGMGLRETGSTGTPTANDVNSIPEYQAVGTLAASAGVTSLNPGLPSGHTRGDVLIAAVASENNATHSCATTGWSKIDQQNSGANLTVSIWKAIQTDAVDVAAPSVTWSGSNDAWGRVFNVRDARDVQLIGTFGSGTTSTHTSTGANTTENNVAVFYVDVAAANTAIATPSGWSEHFDTGSATGPCRIAAGSKEVASSGTGSGNISVTGANAAWVQWQLEVLPASGGTQTVGAEAEDFATFCSMSVSYETVGAEGFVALGWNGTGGGTTDSLIMGGVPINPADAGGTTLTAPKLSSTSVLRAPTAVPLIALTAPKLGSTSTLRAPSSGLGITAPKKSSDSALYAPTAALGNIPVTAPKKSSDSALHAPTAALGNIGVTAPLKTSDGALYAPSSSLGITAPKLASASQLRAPTMALSFTAPKIASGSVLYAPAVSYTLTLTAPTLASTSALRAPSSALAFFAAKLASVSQLYEPTVTADTGEVTLVAPKLASTSVLRAPSASLAIALGAPHLDSVSVIYAPTNAMGVTAPKLGGVSALFAPTVTVSLTLNAPHLASVSALYSPLATVDTGTVTPEPPVVTGTTGGGGAAQFYRGKRRHEVRKAIRAALRELEGTKSTRSRKRKARRIAQALVAEFGVIEFAPVLALARPPLPLAPLVDLQRQVFDLTLALREKEAATAAKAAEMQQLFEAYEREAERLDAQEEEEALAMILAVAS